MAGDFASGAAGDRRDFCAVGGAESLRFALLTDRAGHEFPSKHQDNSAEYAVGRQKTKARHKNSGHDDFVLEAAGGNDQQNSADHHKGEPVSPEMLDGCAPENYAARDIDEIGGGNHVTDGLEDVPHGFARVYIAGEENAGQ